MKRFIILFCFLSILGGCAPALIGSLAGETATQVLYGASVADALYRVSSRHADDVTEEAVKTVMQDQSKAAQTELDTFDVNQIGAVLERQPSGQVFTWYNPNRVTHMEAVPVAATAEDGAVIRRVVVRNCYHSGDTWIVGRRTGENQWRLEIQSVS